MKLSIATTIVFLAIVSNAALAQQTLAQQTPAPQLDPTLTEGRAILSKSCTICHLTMQIGSPTFGPTLNRASLGGNESVLREVISNGTPRMPGWKHMYKPAQIDAIIAYIKTIPAPPPANQSR